MDELGHNSSSEDKTKHTNAGCKRPEGLQTDTGSGCWLPPPLPHPPPLCGREELTPAQEKAFRGVFLADSAVSLSWAHLGWG